MACVVWHRVDNISPTGRKHNGIASHWLSSFKDRAAEGGNTDFVAAFIRTSTFRLPQQGLLVCLRGFGQLLMSAHVFCFFSSSSFLLLLDPIQKTNNATWLKQAAPHL
jgi:hypothetical protein